MKMTEKQVIHIAGYSDKLSLRAGESIEFKVSCHGEKPYTASLCRVISADPNPDGPGIIEQDCEHIFPTQEHPAKEQTFSPGSYAISESPISINSQQGFRIGVTILPTLRKPCLQTVFSVGHISLYIDENGCITLDAAGNKVTIKEPLKLQHWSYIEAGFDVQNRQLYLRQTYQPEHSRQHEVTTELELGSGVNAQHDCSDILLGACLKGVQVTDCFNGKIEAPLLTIYTESAGQQKLYKWDFSQGISTTKVPDQGKEGIHLKLVNFPTRAVTGSNWDSSEMCWRHAPDQYAAIHFHDDDIYDFCWKTSFSLTVPDNLPSGAYAMKVACGEHYDVMPFFVCAPKGKATAKLCVIIPTFTYVIYGNHARPDYKPSWQDRISSWGAYPHNPVEYPEYGLSTYNNHSDGTGICHASHLRPLFNLRPGFLTFACADSGGAGSGLRHFQADSHLFSWLHAKGIEYDVITDHELHHEGVTAIEHYSAVTTTTHPEYHTTETLNAVQDYIDTGGNFCYLGGNGFYWRIAMHQENPNMLEIRRAEDGIRAWASEPGEYYNAFDGKYGGLWRRNGRSPQQLVGIGFTAQGSFEGSYYKRLCFEPKYDWIFAGVTERQIGNYGFSGGGAAGFELDRIDYRLGTPENTVVLAQSDGHGDGFMLVPEEQLTHLTNTAGESEENLLHADMIYFTTSNGGSVFATGSITFCGSLPWNNFDNGVSTILANIIERMVYGTVKYD